MGLDIKVLYTHGYKENLTFIVHLSCVFEIKIFRTSLNIFNPNQPPFSKSEFPHWLQAVQALQKFSTNASLDYNMTAIRKYSTSFDDIISKF